MFFPSPPQPSDLKSVRVVEAERSAEKVSGYLFSSGFCTNITSSSRVIRAEKAVMNIFRRLFEIPRVWEFQVFDMIFQRHSPYLMGAGASAIKFYPYTTIKGGEDGNSM